MCIFSFGLQPPGRDGSIEVWEKLSGAHWPLVRHYGSMPRRSAAKAASRRANDKERWAKAKAKAAAKWTLVGKGAAGANATFVA